MGALGASPPVGTAARVGTRRRPDRAVGGHLPPENLGLYAPSEQLLDAWRAHYALKRPVDRKGFLREERKTPVGLRVIRRAVEHAAISAETQALGLKIQQAAARRT